MSPEPFDSRAKAPPAKRWEKGYGDENGVCCAYRKKLLGYRHHHLWHCGSRPQIDWMLGSQKLSQNFHWKILSNFLMVLEMSSDPKKYSGFTFDEFTKLMYTAKFFGFWLSGMSLFETVTGSLINGCVDNWAIFTVNTSSVNWSNLKPKYFTRSLDISKETPNTFNRFDWRFQSEFGEYPGEYFWLPSI